MLYGLSSKGNLIMKVKTILYVEDEDLIREQLAKFLQRYCDKLYLASNGLEAQEIFDKYNPDIIISDIRMPKKNGIELVKYIKQIDIDKPVIFTTAHSESSYFLDSIELQVDGYMLKPINLQLFSKKLKAIIKHLKLQEDFIIQQEMLSDVAFKEQLTGISDTQQTKILTQQSKLAAIGEMMSAIAHQWRQPLNEMALRIQNIEFDYMYEKVDDIYRKFYS